MNDQSINAATGDSPCQDVGQSGVCQLTDECGVVYEYDPREAPLGSGGFGRVVRARNVTSHGRPVAVKLFELNDGYDAPRVQREVDILRHLAEECTDELSFLHIHGIVRNHEKDSLPIVALICEDLGGQSLVDFMKQDNSLIRVWEILRKLVRALCAQWNAGVIHRDLKPANIMITEGGDPVVIDYGTAYAKHLPNLTQQHMIMGTPSYLPHECLGSIESNRDPAIDIFCLGEILYELLTGGVPFRDRPMNGVVQNPLVIILKDKGYTDEKRQCIHEAVREDRTWPLIDVLLSQMLSRQPKQRPIPSELDERTETIEKLLGESEAVVSSRREPTCLTETVKEAAPPVEKTLASKGIAEPEQVSVDVAALPDVTDDDDESYTPTRVVPSYPSSGLARTPSGTVRMLVPVLTDEVPALQDVPLKADAPLELQARIEGESSTKRPFIHASPFVYAFVLLSWVITGGSVFYFLFHR